MVAIFTTQSFPRRDGRWFAHRIFQAALVITLLLVGVIVAGRFLQLIYRTPAVAPQHSKSVALGGGMVVVGRSAAHPSFPIRGGFELRPFNAWANFLLPQHVVGTTGSATYMPLYLPAILVLILTFILWRIARRTPLGHCPACLYPLTGLRTPTCPECGKSILS